MEDLIKYNNFNEKDALGVKEIIEKEEGLTKRQAKYYDFGRSYDIFGARWSKDEIVEYMNEGMEEEVTIEEILGFDFVHRVNKNLIITWDY